MAVQKRIVHHHRVELLGCLFDLVSMNQTIEKCLAWCKTRRSAHTIATINAAILSALPQDPELRHACIQADLVVPDGVPVVWSSRLIGTPLVERVAGIDLMSNLLQLAASEGLRVYFLGGKQEVIDKLTRLSLERYPGLTICGSHHGYFERQDDQRIIREIRASKPDILFVGMPTPFKEIWCERNKDKLGVPVILGVGGSFDVLAGYLSRAPRFLQRIGMEWSWRLMAEPRKMWRRYLISNPKFIWSVAREIYRRRLLAHHAYPRPNAMGGEGR